MAKYKKVRCIAFCIMPGKRDKAGNVTYLGKESAELDIQKRCAIMKNGVMTAYDELKKLSPKPKPKKLARGAMNVVNADPVLTIFMAPEFFFRGADGAYPIEKISTILPEMAKHTQDAKYRDWLFVYGTAVGYQKLDETITKVAAYQVDKGQSVIKPDALPEQSFTGWNLQEYVKAAVTKVEKGDSDLLRLSLDTGENLDWCGRVSFVHGREAERTEEFEIIARAVREGKALITVRERSTPIREGWTAELFAVPDDSQRVFSDAEDGGVQANVLKVDSAGDGNVQLTLATNAPTASGSKVTFTRTDGSETSPFPVRRWGREPETQNTTITLWNEGQRRQERCPNPSCNCTAFVPHPLDANRCVDCTHLHAKDPIRVGWTSNLKGRYLRVDNENVHYTPGRFLVLRRDPSDSETEVFNIALVQMGGAGSRELLVYKQEYSQFDYEEGHGGKFKVHGEERNLVPTERMEGGRESKGGDLSGDPVFSVEECTVGLEVCLDHAIGRLDKFYKGPHGAGKPKPQVLLIPSWGMRIGLGPLCCQDSAVIFNVDGSAGDSVMRIFDGAFGCPHDTSQKGVAAEYCPTCMRYYCPTCKDFVATPDGKLSSGCSRCGGHSLRRFYYCETDNKVDFHQVNCPVCHKPLELFDKKLKMIGSSVRPVAGPTTVKLRGADWLKVTQKNYFAGKGNIVIYPEKPIPNA